MSEIQPTSEHAPYCLPEQTGREDRPPALQILPIVMLHGLLIAIIAFKLLYVVPRFVTIFADFGASLPGSTRLLISVADSLSAHPVLFLVLGVTYLAAIAFAAHLSLLARPAQALRLWLSGTVIFGFATVTCIIAALYLPVLTLPNHLP